MKLMRNIIFVLIVAFVLGNIWSCSDDLEDVEITEEITGDDDDNEDEEETGEDEEGTDEDGEQPGESGDGEDDEEDGEEPDEDDDDEEDFEDYDEYDEISLHPSLYLVRLDPSVTEEEIADLLEDLNSEEIWHREEINLRLWNTTAYPYTDAQGQQITNIDGQIRRARTRARLNDVAFNIGYSFQPPNASQSSICFDDVNVLAPLGDNGVKISIFDSGIDENALLEAGYPLDSYSGYDYVNDDGEPNDDNGHGTQITGLIYSLLGQGQELDNIEFDIRKTHSAEGVGFVSDLIPAILDAVEEGAQILNLSFSYQDINVNTQDRPLRLAIDYAEANGALIIASAGNTSVNNDTNDIVAFPASYPNPNIISVASTACDDSLSAFSSFGQNSVDVAYLGENIPTIGINGDQGENSGTSYTSAIVTAMAAIMASQQGNTNDIKCSLIQTSVPSPSLEGRIAAGGTIDFTAALSGMGSCN